MGGEQPDKHSKTEAPTSHKLQKSREQGQVAKSQDLSSTSGFVAGLYLLGFLSPHMGRNLHGLFKQVIFDFDYNKVGPEAINLIIMYMFKALILLIIPVTITVWLVTFAATAAQVGFHFSAKPLEPNPSKLNPVQGFQRLVSLRGVMNTSLSIIKMIIVGFIASSVITNPENTLALLHLHTVSAVLMKMGAILWELAFKVSITLILMAFVDYAYQKWQFTEDQKMTKHELKEEHKTLEGNPTIKGKIKSIQKETAKRLGLRETIAEADVVITNPFHIAVAIKYERTGGENAPIVVAKGARLLAERIKEFARESDVEIIVNIPLARALYTQCVVGFEISPDLYVAVAEVLAVIFQKRDEEDRKSRMRSVGAGDIYRA